MSVSFADPLLADTTALAVRLARHIKGEVLFDRASRGRYATDASIYQIEPVGVIVPETVDDVRAALGIAREEGLAILPRGSGTSQCGQTVNRALVMDCSKYLRRILHIDPDGCTALVEPGLVLAHLNAALRKHGLFFPVDPSTHTRCTIGGMAGNNSCGSKSIRYGLMADNVRAIDAILADGSRHVFGAMSDDFADGTPARIVDLVQRLRTLGAAEADEIAARFPKQLRRVGGYNIDILTPAARAAGRDNLARLLVGSEGTLAFSAALELTLHRIKPRKVLGICQFADFRSAMAAAQHIVALDPEAVELVDRTMIDLGRSIPIYRATIDQMLIGEPDSLLIVEFHGHEDTPLLTKLHDLETLMGDLGHPDIVRAIDPGFQADIAAVREAGLNIMMSMKGDGKPVSFIEDCAVDLADLADYTERLNGVFERHGTKGTWYAHASVGCLHVRPVLNMKDPAGVATMRAVAEECFALVREYKGSHSGEHGDGLIRSEFHAQMFGPRIVRVFEAVKDAFDPTDLLNPHRIVRPLRMDDRTLFRYAPGYEAVPNFSPHLDWSDHPGPLGGMLGAVEMCNNNGTCRGFDVGVMCPSYRATRDEIHLTRGRANTLRLALTGQLGADAMSSNALQDSMALCVSCKACRRECPTGIDMAKMKIEVLAARADRFGVSWKETLIAELPRMAPVVSRMPGLANLRNRLPPLRWIGERWFGLAAIRPLPTWRRDRFRDEEAEAVAPASPRASVYLWADTFNRYFEPENIRAALKVLAAAGYRAIVPPTKGRPLCCGRTWLASGLVDRARAEASRTLRRMPDDIPIVGLEPACVMTLRDEFRSLLPGAATDRFTKRAMLISELLVLEKPELPLRPLSGSARVHGHCHQKAFGAFPDALAMLRMIPEMRVEPIASSCCGMAGMFGYQAETQTISRDMAEASLLPAIRAAERDAAIVADGTSCRHQIRDLAGREAIHSIRLLERALTRNLKPM
ncbi:FAD-binding and (Fe-S)-binding domain-containing protein [Rhodopila sp.]|uniref:FAD-binding and (Fe-S)-binding domain-containing protein n=1 Tax=Rhodopila sp. TaxID=2480087 RepID=UPI002CE7C663|nr:FAD-linked oxidase C-terminal domain-containing protein [Rhodopila sp.]HVZ10696.1 FAD-linked oxidase C-terminal domain-containing protein [Rhodopila sp.]